MRRRCYRSVTRRTGVAVTVAAMVSGACTSADGSACAPSGCTGTYFDPSARPVATMVNGCLVVRCCVSPDADEAGDAGSESEMRDNLPPNRPSRKNASSRSGHILSIVDTCIAHDVSPRAYLYKVVYAIVHEWSRAKLRELLPDRLLVAYPELYVGDSDALPLPSPQWPLTSRMPQPITASSRVRLTAWTSETLQRP